MKQICTLTILTFCFFKANAQTVNILIIDAGVHARNVEQVITNRAFPNSLTDYDNQYINDVLFDLNQDIVYSTTEDYDNFNPNYELADIINMSSSVQYNKSAINNFNKFLDETKFPTFPLIVTSGGNGVNVCTQEAYDFSIKQGGLSWYDHIAPYYSCDKAGDGSDCDPQALILYKACDIGAAYIVQQTDHAEDIIIVGSATHLEGSRPGPILKNRWISTYYQFDFEDSIKQGTSYSVPYVVKIAAEIKRRAPKYTNEEIAQLIFTTAIDIGDPGIDEDYGHGFLNPKGIFDELTRRGIGLSTTNSELETKIKLFPNPSTEYIQISGLKKNTENYIIENTLGQETLKGKITSNQKIDIQNLTKGLYFLKLENGNTIKFIKEETKK